MGSSAGLMVPRPVHAAGPSHEERGLAWALIDHRKWTYPTPYEAWDLQPRLVPTFAMEANSLCGRKGSSFKICTTSGRSSRQTLIELIFDQ